MYRAQLQLHYHQVDMQYHHYALLHGRRQVLKLGEGGGGGGGGLINQARVACQEIWGDTPIC